MTTYINSSNRDGRHIAYWLFVMCLLVFLMIVVGGITRLTESGLSMVSWHPIRDIVPPLNDASWIAEFNAYKAYPEYQKINMNMTLDEFKNIYFWEYLHRLLGRLMGLVYAIPFFVFLFKNKIKRALKPHLWTLLFLGGSQGLLGWWMVKSGLVDRPDVSHYRLAAHLGLAVLIYIYMFWLALGLFLTKPGKGKKRPYGLTLIFVKFVFLQIILGALVAGLNAGLVSDTWPLMNGQIIPDGLFFYSPWYNNLFDNPLTLHFEHRILAYIISIMALVLWWISRRSDNLHVRNASLILLITVLLQVILGILTILTMVSIPLAALHQACAIITLTAGLYLLNRVKS